MGHTVPLEVVGNKRAKVWWGFNFQTDKKLLANQPEIALVDKEQKGKLVIDVAMPTDNNSKKNCKKKQAEVTKAKATTRTDLRSLS